MTDPTGPLPAAHCTLPAGSDVVDDQQPPAQRDVAEILDELREVERHLREVPPHHGGGAADLSARADALRRELARVRATRATDD